MALVCVAPAWGLQAGTAKDFMPHGYCYLWDPLVLWLNLVSDALITLSYYCIPIVLLYFARKNRELPFNRIFWMFGTFILACGTTHLMEVWNIWHANYLLAGTIKAFTAAVSVLTAGMIVPLVPKAVGLPRSIDLLEVNRRLEWKLEQKERSAAATEMPLQRNVKLMSRMTAGILTVVGILVVALLATEHTAHPDLHTILDSSLFLLSGLLALLFWDIGARSGRPLAKWIGVSFALTSVSECIHALASLEWSGELKAVAQANHWRSATWSPGAYLLPIGILAAIWLTSHEVKRGAEFAAALAALDVVLFMIFYNLPPYSSPWLGVARPSLLLVPALWAFAAWKCRKLGDSDRIFPALALMAATLFVGSVLILFSRHSHDGLGMSCHLLKAGGYLGLMVSLMQMASADMLDRVRAQRALGQLNEELEMRVVARTTELESINLSLQKEIQARISEEQARRGTERQLAAIVDSSEDAIFSKDLGGKIVSWNKGAEKLYGFTAREAIGQASTIIIPAELRDDEKQVLAEVAAGRKAQRDEVTRLRKDGSLVPVTIAISPVRDANGQIVGAASISHDITDRLRMEIALRASQSRMESILDSAMDAIIIIDDRQQIVLFNAAAEKMFLCPARLAIGSPWERFIPDRFREIHGSDIRRYGESGFTSGGMGVMGAIWGLRADGQEFPVEASISQVETGGKKLFTLILRDITERKRSEEKLAEQARMLDMTTLLVRDFDGRISLWTRGAEQLYGYSREEAVGRITHELFQTKFPDSLRSLEESLIESGRWEGELEHCKKDGGTVYVTSVQIVYRDEEGRAVRVLEANTDITRRKQDEERLANQAHDLMVTQDALREQSRTFQLVMDNMGEGLVAADENGSFLLWNQAAEKMLGRGPAVIQPEEWAAHYGAYLSDGSTLLPLDRNPLARAMLGEVCELELMMRPPGSDKATWIEVAAQPLRDSTGASKGGVVVLRDMTQRKHDEYEIRRLNEELEQRVIQRTAQLEAANKELEAFTYSVSHDLRAPLRHISGFTRILVEDFGSSLPEEAHKHLERIEQGTNRMGRLVDELLNLTRVGRQALTVQVTGISSIVKDVVTMLEPETEKRQVEWKIGELPFVECDPTLLRQVFENLLSNALKYSRPRPLAVIEVGQTEKDGSTTIFVRDNGVGFSMKYADKLFGVFQRLHRPEDFEGTGVGLATVHRIIQKHGGRIWAEAELDRGATFYFTLGGLNQAAKTGSAAMGGRA
jgi:PAS domain S-box-containing protein